MNIEEIAFKDRKNLVQLNENDLLDIIEFLQQDRKQWINQFTQTHNESVKIQEENQKLKDELKNKPDTQITLKDDKGNKYTLIQTERIDIQVELNKTIEKLFNNWVKLKEYIDIKLYNVEYLQKLCGYRIDDEIHMILDIIKKKMQELEIGIDRINNLKEK